VLEVYPSSWRVIVLYSYASVFEQVRIISIVSLV
jgi:hypothetical protein